MPSQPINMTQLAGVSVSGNKIVGGISAVRSAPVEAAGRGYHAQFEQVDDTQFSEYTASVLAEMTPKSDMTGDSTPAMKDTKTKKGGAQATLKLSEALEGRDLYEFLECDPEATGGEIKAKYEKLKLRYHPDKACREFPDMDEKELAQQYNAFQEAADVLTDPAKRGKYDSSLDFDDKIPSDKAAEAANCLEDTAAFHALFGPVFRSNGKWSRRQPAPLLPGAEVTDIEQVKKFYLFWTQFESWRDFDATILKEEGEDALDDPEKADSREERRHMEKKNEQKRRKYREDEFKRILTLAERAEKFDKRVQDHKAAEFLKKNAGKLAKQQEAADREAKAAADAAAAEAADKQAAAEKENAKKGKEAAKEAVKKCRQALRKLAKEKAPTASSTQFQELVTTLDADGCAALLKEMEATKDLKACIFANVKKTLGVDGQSQEAPAEEEVAPAAAAPVQEQSGGNSKKSKKDKKKGKKGGGAAGGGAEDDEDDDYEDDAADAMQAKMESHKGEGAGGGGMSHAAKKAEKKAREQAKKEEKRKADAQEEDLKKQQEDILNEANKKKDADKKAAADKKQGAASASAAAAKNEELNKKGAEKKKELNFNIIRQEQLASYEKHAESLKDDVMHELNKNEGHHNGPAVKQAMKNLRLTKSGKINDYEDKLTCAAVLLSEFTNFKFFEMAKLITAPEEMEKVPEFAENALRNKVKKARTAMRKMLLDFITKEDRDIEQDNYTPPKPMAKIFGGDYPSESWEDIANMDMSKVADGQFLTPEDGGEGDEDKKDKKKKKKKAGKGGNNEQDEDEKFLKEMEAAAKAERHAANQGGRKKA